MSSQVKTNPTPGNNLPIPPPITRVAPAAPAQRAPPPIPPPPLPRDKALVVPPPLRPAPSVPLSKSQ